MLNIIREDHIDFEPLLKRITVLPETTDGNRRALIEFASAWFNERLGFKHRFASLPFSLPPAPTRRPPFHARTPHPCGAKRRVV